MVVVVVAAVPWGDGSELSPVCRFAVCERVGYARDLLLADRVADRDQLDVIGEILGPSEVELEVLLDLLPVEAALGRVQAERALQRVELAGDRLLGGEDAAIAGLPVDLERPQLVLEQLVEGEADDPDRSRGRAGWPIGLGAGDGVPDLVVAREGPVVGAEVREGRVGDAEDPLAEELEVARVLLGADGGRAGSGRSSG